MHRANNFSFLINIKKWIGAIRSKSKNDKNAIVHVYQKTYGQNVGRKRRKNYVKTMFKPAAQEKNTKTIFNRLQVTTIS